MGAFNDGFIQLVKGSLELCGKDGSRTVGSPSSDRISCDLTDGIEIA